MSRSTHPMVARPALALWQFFADVDLSDARESQFESLHACFIRELRPGARPVDPRPGVLVSPCDALIGAHGSIREGMALQAKGHAYPLGELLCDAGLAAAHEGDAYVTLRLTAGMYHRFHAPADGHIERVDHVPGDTWNVNPPALARVERLYCRNERAVLRCRLADGEPFTLVPVAAILVASLRLHCLARTLNMDYRGASRIECQAVHTRGEELGWFEHGSTVIMIAPAGFVLAPDLAQGRRLRMGEALFVRLDASGPEPLSAVT